MTRRLRDIGLEAGLPVLLVAVWWITSADSQSIYFPPLREILATFADVWLFDRVASDLVPSLIRFTAGFLIAVAGGVALGLLLGLSPAARRATDPIVDFLRTLPKPAIIPPAILFLGVDASMKVFIIAFGAIWPVLLNTVDGVRGIDSDTVDMARVYGLRRSERIRRVVLPAATPQIFAGARLALAIALILMVVSEMVASTDGLGYFVLLSQQTFAIPEMWSGIILLGLIGYLFNGIFVLTERRALRWHRGWRAAALGQPVDTAAAPERSKVLAAQTADARSDDA